MKYLKKFEGVVVRDTNNYFGIEATDEVIFDDEFMNRDPKLTKGQKYIVLDVMDNNHNPKEEVDDSSDLISVIDNHNEICYMYANRFLKELFVDANKYNL